MLKKVLIIVVVLFALGAGAGYWVLSKAGERAPGQFFDSAGVKIFYTDEGPRDAEPVLLVHGFGINADLNWRTNGIVQNLSKDYRVITLDDRGHGLSDKPHDPAAYGIEMVNDLSRLLDHLKIQKVHLIGYSMGAFITMRAIASIPGRLLSAMPCGAGWSKAEGENLKFLQTLGDELAAGGGFDALAKRLEPDGKEPSPVKVASMNFGLSRINDKQALAAVIRGFPGLVVQEVELRKNKVPVKAVVGTRDPLRDGIDNMKDVMANLKTVYIEGGDHMTVPGDKRYVAAIREFLSEHRATASATPSPATPSVTPAMNLAPAAAQ